MKAQKRLGVLGLPPDFFAFSDMLKSKVEQGKDPLKAAAEIIRERTEQSFRLYANIDEAAEQLIENIGRAMKKLGIEKIDFVTLDRLKVQVS